MDSLTEKGMKFISANRQLLTEFAKRKIAEGCEEDDWVSFDMSTMQETTMESLPENTIDINLYLPDDVENAPENWQPCAYPLEVNSVGEIQTNCGPYLPLYAAEIKGDWWN